MAILMGWRQESESVKYGIPNLTEVKSNLDEIFDSIKSQLQQLLFSIVGLLVFYPMFLSL